MDCKDIEDKTFPYLDGALSDRDMQAVADHVQNCDFCGDIITRHQKTAVLLKTAVADVAAAVDVSGLWRGIESRLGPLPKRRFVFWPERARAWTMARLEELAATPLRAGLWGGAAVLAATALFFSLRTIEPLRGGPALSEVPLRSVRVDMLEAAAGYTVSTWTQPRTRTRVIWVSSETELSVLPASHRR